MPEEVNMKKAWHESITVRAGLFLTYGMKISAHKKAFLSPGKPCARQLYANGFRISERAGKIVKVRAPADIL